MVRKLDELGRIVIPIEFRKINDWKTSEEIEIIENGEELILRKYSNKECKICGKRNLKKDNYCSNCGNKLK